MVRQSRILAVSALTAAWASWNLLSVLSPGAPEASFLPGAGAGRRHRKGAGRGAVSEAQVAAALRLPVKPPQHSPQADDMEVPEEMEISAARRAGLRLPKPEEQAKRVADRRQQKMLEDMIEVNGDPDKMGAVEGTLYKLAFAMIALNIFVVVLSKFGHLVQQSSAPPVL